MKKPTSLESILPCSGEYSWKRDFRLHAWLGVAAIVYVVQLAVLKHANSLSPLVRALITLTPLLPGVLYVRSWIRFIRQLDELQRRAQIDAYLFAAFGALVCTVVVDNLNANGIQPLGIDHGLGLGRTAFILIPLWLVGTALANRRYK